uniref:uncharacterized protein LOC103794320 n=1 Tax=Callithrix jacchus TaxID=9483 RepID=UPI0023DCF219|nr:uncharacterized protein LOC103794320 [Callithrix jacchus]
MLSLSHTVPFCINRFADYFTLMSSSSRPEETLKRRENLKETSPDIEKHVTQYCHRAVQVPQDLSLEHIKDDELPRDVEKPTVWCYRRPVEVPQDLILEDIEDEELPRDEEKPAVSCHRRPVEVPQDLILEDIEDEELPRDEEKRAIWCHRRPLEIILEDDEDEDLPRDVDTVTAPNDLPPPEDCRSPKCEEDGEGSSLAVDVSSSDLASTVGLRSQTEEEDLEEENLYGISQKRVKSWLGSVFKAKEDDPQGQ